MSETVTVIIPTFNRPKLVQEAIESVLAQTGGARFEIIVVDDGSTPDTEVALRRFCDRICYVRQDNAGLNPARNVGLRLAQSEFIALLDDDDVWLPFKTEVQLAALKHFPSAGFVHSNFHIWKPKSGVRTPDGLRTWFPRPYEWTELYEHSETIWARPHSRAGIQTTHFPAYFGDTYFWALFAPMVLPSTAIVRRSAIEDGFKFPEVNSTGDWEFFARLSRRHGGVFLPDETTLNRSHEDQFRLTRVESSIRMRRRIEMIRRLWRRDPEFVAAHAGLLDRTEAECLRKLARRLLMKGESAAAGQAIAELRLLGSAVSKYDDVLLSALSKLPFAGGLARAAGQLGGLMGKR